MIEYIHICVKTDGRSVGQVTITNEQSSITNFTLHLLDVYLGRIAGFKDGIHFLRR